MFSKGKPVGDDPASGESRKSYEQTPSRIVFYSGQLLGCSPIQFGYDQLGAARYDQKVGDQRVGLFKSDF